MTARVWLRTVNTYNWHAINHEWTAVSIVGKIVRLPRGRTNFSLNRNSHTLASTCLVILYNWCKLLLLTRLSLQHHRRLLYLLLLSLLVHLMMPQTLVRPRETLWAVLASVRLLSSVNSKVSAHVVGASEEAPAVGVWAGKGLLAGVRAHVSLEFVLAVEGLVALLAVGEHVLAAKFLFLWLFRSSFGFRDGGRLAFYNFRAGRRFHVESW